MPAKTNTEKIEDLTRLVNILEDRLVTLRKETDGLPALSTRVTVLEHRVSEQKQNLDQHLAELKKNLDSLTTRLWQIGIPLILAVLGALLTALLRK